MPKYSVKVKWGKETFADVEMNTDEDPEMFKAQIFALTGVLPERQKVVCKGVTLRDDSWANFKLDNNALVLVMGSKEEDVPSALVEQTKFVEDMNESELASATMDFSDKITIGKKPETSKSKMLLIEEAKLKLYRPNVYDIGGTYVDNEPDYWFTFQSEVVGDVILLHLFVKNEKANKFFISVSSCSDDKTIDKNNESIILTSTLSEHSYSPLEAGETSYITTYSFEEADVASPSYTFDNLLIPIEISTSSTNKFPNKTFEEMKMAHDLRSLINNPEGSDFIITSETGDQIYTHKIVLEMNSKVFAAMFKEENQQLLVEKNQITETCSTEDLKDFVEYLYTGTLSCADLEGQSDATGMLYLADKYEVPGLKELAENILCKSTNPDNALYNLVKGDMYNSDKVKWVALKSLNQCSIDIHQIREYTTNQDLILEILEFVSPLKVDT